MPTSDRLWRNARETFTWPISAVDEDGEPIDVDAVDIVFVPNSGPIVGGVTYPTATNVPVVAGKASRLLAGPDAAAGADVVLPVGTHRPWFLVTDNDEQIPRPGPRIYVS